MCRLSRLLSGRQSAHRKSIPIKPILLELENRIVPSATGLDVHPVHPVPIQPASLAAVHLHVAPIHTHGHGHSTGVVSFAGPDAGGAIGTPSATYNFANVKAAKDGATITIKLSAADGTTYQETVTFDVNSTPLDVANAFYNSMKGANWFVTQSGTTLVVTGTNPPRGSGSPINGATVQWNSLVDGKTPALATTSGVKRSGSSPSILPLSGSSPTPWTVTISPTSSTSTVDQSETFALTIDGVEVDYAASAGDTPQTVATGLYDAMLADGFQGVTLGTDSLSFTNNQQGYLAGEVDFNITWSGGGSSSSNSLELGVDIPDYSSYTSG